LRDHPIHRNRHGKSCKSTDRRDVGQPLSHIMTINRYVRQRHRDILYGYLKCQSTRKFVGLLLVHSMLSARYAEHTMAKSNDYSSSFPFAGRASATPGVRLRNIGVAEPSSAGERWSNFQRRSKSSAYLTIGGADFLEPSVIPFFRTWIVRRATPAILPHSNGVSEIRPSAKSVRG
jgi:hypothetical protein